MEDYKKLYEQTQSKMKEFIKRWDGIKLSSNDLFTEELKQIVEIESEDERIRKEIIEMVRNWASVHYITKEQFSERMTWLEKQGESGTFDIPQTPIKDAVEVTSRMQFISDDMKPIAEFIMGYANWNLHKDEWNQPTLTVPLFRVLDALIQRGKPYGECSQNIEKQDEQKPTIEMKSAEESLGISSEEYNKIVDKLIYDEQKHTDKVEPKFKVGDWITNDYCVGKVIELTNDAYLLDTGQGIPFSCEHNVHLWTIQDAKDGDVLIDKSHIGECVFIFKEARASDIKTDVNNPLAIIGYCGINHIGFTSRLSGLGFGDTVNCTYYPATKEQRDTLERVMTNAGYRWNKEELKLEKI